MIMDKSPDLDEVLNEYEATYNLKKLRKRLKELCGDNESSEEEETPVMQVNKNLYLFLIVFTNIDDEPRGSSLENEKEKKRNRGEEKIASKVY